MHIEGVEKNTNRQEEFEIHATYDEIVEVMGDPKDISLGTLKSDVFWHVKDSDTGRELRIWNYKDGPNYKGEQMGIRVELIQNWSAGGSEELAEDLGLEVEDLGY